MSETLTRDNLFAGQVVDITEVLTITGANLVRGTVLGKITLGTATKANDGGGEAGANTGDGTFTLDSTTPIQAKAKPGIYRVKVIRAAVAQVGTTPPVPAQAALAELRDPDGNVLEVFEVLGSSGTTITNQIKFVMVEGSTKFVVGDGFKVTIAAGSGSCVAVNSALLNGAQYPYAILGEDAAAGSADVKAFAYKAGVFNRNALTFGGSDTYATHEAALRDIGIYLKDTLQD